jgi:hypothetical protein
MRRQTCEENAMDEDNQLRRPSRPNAGLETMAAIEMKPVHPGIIHNQEVSARWRIRIFLGQIASPQMLVEISGFQLRLSPVQVWRRPASLRQI